jgi:hypothetical protein
VADNYPVAIAFALTHEGSAYVDDPRDPGGATHFGITLGTLQDYAKRFGLAHDGLHLDVNSDGHIDVRDIRALGHDFAVAFYREFVWQPLFLGEVKDAKVAAKLLDEAINLGPRGIGRVVGGALIAAGIRNAPTSLTETTIGLINRLDPARYLVWLKRGLVANYENIVAAKPQDSVFLKGWIARANA